MMILELQMSKYIPIPKLNVQTPQFLHYQNFKLLAIK